MNYKYKYKDNKCIYNSIFIMTNTLTLNDSNKKIIELIQKDEPFMICRLSDNATKLALNYELNNNIHPMFKKLASSHDGIYSKEDSDLILYSKFYMKALKNMTLLACFPKLCVNSQNIIIRLLNVKQENVIYNFTLEPYYILDKDNVRWTHPLRDAGLTNNTTPWTHFLKDKKVLIVSHFVETFQKQLKNDFKFFGENDNRYIWDKNQQFIFYKAYNCLYNNHPHKNWFETFKKMCEDIKKLDFDVALLSCGGYGLPLCNFIYEQLGKSSIYVGGALQLYFGVYGNRWIRDKHPIITRLIKEPNNKWVRPSDSEKPANYQKVEGGCYW